MDTNPLAYVESIRSEVAEIEARLRPIEAEAEKLRLQRDLAKAKLLGAEELLQRIGHGVASDATPSGRRQTRHRSRAGSKGRQPGAISKVWRNILLDLKDTFPEGFDEEDVRLVASEHGLSKLRPKDARDRMEAYSKHQYTTEIDGRYLVTDYAARHFDFTAMRAARDEDRNENEPPEGGSDTGDSPSAAKRVDSLLSSTSLTSGTDPAPFGSREGG